MNIRKTTTAEIDWNAIKKAQADGKLGELLQLGDELDITLKTGEELTAQVADTKEHMKLVLKDCMKDERSMNKKPTNKGGWRDSDMRLWLNETIFHMLPDELQEIIVPRRIVQTVDGETLESEDKLWLPSFTEMFGMNERLAQADTGETQMELFITERGRVKEVPGKGTWWYWLRSPRGSYSTRFCIVNSDGGASYNNASNSNGVAFGFCL